MTLVSEYKGNIFQINGTYFFKPNKTVENVNDISDVLVLLLLFPDLAKFFFLN